MKIMGIVGKGEEILRLRKIIWRMTMILSIIKIIVKILR